MSHVDLTLNRRPDPRMYRAEPTQTEAPQKLPQPSWMALIAITAVVAGLTWSLVQERMLDIDPRQIVAVNLKAAELAMQDGRFVDPPRRSALDYFTTVLVLDPTNAAAQNGLDRIAQHYIDRTKDAIVAGRLADAVTALDGLRQAQPGHRRLPYLETQLKRALEERARTARDAGFVGARPDRESMTRESKASAAASGSPPQIAQRAPTRPDAAEAAARDREIARDEALMSARLALEQAELAIARERIDEARSLGASERDLAALLRALDEAQQRAMRASATVVESGASEDPAEESAVQTVSIPEGIAQTIGEGIGEGIGQGIDRSIDGRVNESVEGTEAPAQERELVQIVQPEYPIPARVRGIEGWVDLTLSVTAAGDVAKARVEAREGTRLFERAALDAVKRWKYAPREGAPEQVPVRIAFRLEE